MSKHIFTTSYQDFNNMLASVPNVALEMQAPSKDNTIVLAHHIMAKTKEHASRSTYIVYNFLSYEPTIYADDAKGRYEVSVEVEIHSLYSFETPKLIELIDNLYDTAKAFGYSMEVSDSSTYDLETKRYTIKFELIKIFN